MQGLVLAPGAVTAENMSAHVRMCGAETVGKPFGPGVVATSGPGHMADAVRRPPCRIEITNVYNPKFRQFMFSIPGRR